MSSGYVFLTDCADFSEAQVVKSYLVSQGFSAKVRDEQMRTVAPHLNHLLGKLIIEVPEYEFLEASLALEKMERPNLSVVQAGDVSPENEDPLLRTQALAKKSLSNAIIGCIFIPVICNFYSYYLAMQVLKYEKPLSKKSRTRLFWAVIFNCIAFYFWLTFGPKFFLRNY
jgi:hypothetical protein